MPIGPVSSKYHRSLTNTIAQSHDAKMVSMTWSLQLLVALVAVVTSSMVVQCVAAVGEIAHVVIFNKNQVRSDMSCTDAEFALIRDTIVQAAVSKRRGLTTLGRGTRGQVASSLPVATATATDSSSRRRLRVQSKCSNCGPYCGAGGTGCPGKGGRRRRRSRRRTLTNNNSSPQLTMATCQGKIPAVDDALKALERSATMSASCRKLVGSSRDISCHEFTNDCGVSYVSLMDARNTNTVLVPKLPPTGTVFCQSTKVSFLATTSFWLGEVNFDLKSSSTNGGVSEQHSQDEAPYYMDGDSGQDYKAGNYTLTVSSQYMANQALTIQFRVNPC
jgi:hypothetical protein